MFLYGPNSIQPKLIFRWWSTTYKVLLYHTANICVYQHEIHFSRDMCIQSYVYAEFSTIKRKLSVSRIGSTVERFAIAAAKKDMGNGNI